jgi:hypothetical protein
LPVTDAILWASAAELAKRKTISNKPNSHVCFAIKDPLFDVMDPALSEIARRAVPDISEDIVFMFLKFCGSGELNSLLVHYEINLK